MSKRMTWLAGAATSVVLVAGCDEPQAEDGFCECGDVEAREVQGNGINLNGINLNGINLNGINLNGINLNGTLLGAYGGDYVTLDKIRTRGDTLDIKSSWLEGSNLFVKSTTNVVLGGIQLDAAKLKFEVRENGWTKTKTIKVLDVEQLAPGSDVWLYDLAIKTGFDDWTPLCLDNAGEPTQAILLGDVWSPETGDRRASMSGTATFACRDAALAKCVEWGYRPWASKSGQSLRDYHQACTRLVRADYCGDGTAHTLYGTPVHVLDQLGIQNVDPTHQFVIEAEWGPDGAVCLNQANKRVVAGQALACNIPTCGAPFASGGLIQSGKVVVGP
ncbi:ADYC domain-containing protein [Nannocystis radixulma]|uniref:ADYC domain-containing protein n=1 Tax=Nannocystis radixulma TaxID=2995305 RepID=A0ABT5BI29_9BACT|nr:ADYC domain-containing protein [Nannocystis radixulma]MDC0673820.1 ADYC domain-containing protein [Nannocystis radixulma]